MELLSAAQSLISESLAPSTRKAYDSAYRRWEIFTQEYGYEALPASPRDISCYLAFLGIQEASFGTAQTAVAAIADRHAQSFLESPCTHVSVKRALGDTSGGRRTKQFIR